MFCILGCAMTQTEFQHKSKADALPRKVILGTVMQRFDGTLHDRLKLAETVIAEVGTEAANKYPGRKLDLVVLPEFAIATGKGQGYELAVKLEGEVENRLGAAARRLGAYVIVPVTLQEGKRLSNAAVLFDRTGKVFGIYRKVHTVVDDKDAIENGVNPGADYPVFDCDFGKLGIQICWDMSYPDGWDALAAKGAELVASPSASPATIRIAAHAVRCGYWVITSTVRDNVTLFNPLGMISRQSTSGRAMVCEIDLSYALLGWSETLDNGNAMKKKYGDRVGYLFSIREDGGVFWSNDPTKTIGSMYREMGLREVTVDISQSERVNDMARGGKAK